MRALALLSARSISAGIVYSFQCRLYRDSLHRSHTQSDALLSWIVFAKDSLCGWRLNKNFTV